MTDGKAVEVGVLAIQGSFMEHIHSVRRAAADLQVPVDCHEMTDGKAVEVGVLAIQGSFMEHIHSVRRAAADLQVPVDCHEVRSCSDLTPRMAGLIIPGGESTAISLFMKRNQMEAVLRAWTREEGHVTWGTCAGLIMLADNIENEKIDGQPRLGGLAAVVRRNHFGRQVNSFEALLNVTDSTLGRGYCHGVFIRAPAVVRTLNDDVSVLATVSVNNDDIVCSGGGNVTNGDVVESVGVASNDVTSSRDDVIVAVRHGNFLGTAFHPELTEDLRWHRLFLQMISDMK